MMNHADLHPKSPVVRDSKEALPAIIPSRSGQPMPISQKKTLSRAEEVRVLQAMVGNQAVGQLLAGETEPEQRAEQNPTSLPGQLKAGLEQMSGLDMSDVRVHANSRKPAQVGALAFTSGKDIYLQPGQEHHLAHEAWHAVQQKTGRVRPTTQLAGVAINDDASLEKEADVMGGRALQGKFSNPVQRFEADEEEEMVQPKMKTANTQYTQYTDTRP